MTNDSKHTAIPTNIAKSGKLLGAYTFNEIGDETLADVADYTFVSIFMEMEQNHKHTASMTNQTKH